MGPVSVANVVCWICSEAFKTQRDLKNHLIARPHERMRIICPWCPLKEGKREKTLRRMSDLKGHLHDQHNSVSISKLPSDFFTEANGFYLGLYPKDYTRIVTPSSFRGEAATIARGEVLRWLRDNKRPEKERERWLRDWGMARQEPVKRPFTPEEEFHPDYEEVTSEKRAREYSPTRPSMADWGVKHINLTGAATTVDIIGGDNIFQLTLQPGIWKEAKIFASLMRRSEQPSYDQHFEAPSTWNELRIEDSEQLLRDLALTAGIPTDMIMGIKRSDKETFHLRVVEKPKQVSQREHEVSDKEQQDGKEKPKLDQLEILDSSVTPRQEKTVDKEGAQDAVQASDLVSEVVMSQDEDVTIQGADEVKGRDEIVETEDEREAEKDKEPTEDISMSSPSAIGTTKQQPSVTTIPSPVYPMMSPAFNSIGDISQDASKTPSTPCYQPANSPTPVLSEIISSENSCELSNAYPDSQRSSVIGSRNVSLPLPVVMPLIPTSKKGITDHRSCALKLLANGCMPLFPPAKRNWEGRSVQLPCGRRTITWPPHGWQQMTADQRLLQWEFAAMQLNCESSEKPTVDRLDLLAHFNMLALPGTAMPSLKPSPVHKMRFYNHDVIRKIAVTSSSTSEELDILKQFVEASKLRDTRTDNLLRYLQSQNVGLRL